MSKLKAILDLGLGVVSNKASKKQEEKHKKIADENKQKFMKVWEEKYGKDIKGRKPLGFFEDSSNNDKEL